MAGKYLLSHDVNVKRRLIVTVHVLFTLFILLSGEFYGNYLVHTLEVEVQTNSVLVVGFGKTCSEGKNGPHPQCDEDKNLYCTPQEQICRCKTNAGLVYVDYLDECVSQTSTSPGASALSQEALEGENVKESKVEIDTERTGGATTVDINSSDSCRNNKNEKEETCSNDESGADETKPVLLKLQHDMKVSESSNHEVLNSNTQTKSERMEQNESYDDHEFENWRGENDDIIEYASNESVQINEIYVFETLFEMFHKREKGHIFKDELGKFFHLLMGIKTVTRLEVGLLFSFMDLNKDDKITSNEYLIAMFLSSEEKIMECFNSFHPDMNCVYEEDVEAFSTDNNVEYDFLILDTDDDECFTSMEYKYFLNRFGIGFGRWEQEWIRNIDMSDIARLKTSQWGKNSVFIKELEISRALYERNTQIKLEAAEGNLFLTDHNHDSFLDKTELIYDLDWNEIKVTDEEFDELFTLLDYNMDGRVSHAEFMILFQNPVTDNAKFFEWLDTFWTEKTYPDSGVDSETVISYNPKQTNFESTITPTPISSYTVTFSGTKPPTVPDHSIQAFNFFDADKNEELCWKELKLLMEMHQRFQFHRISNSTFIELDSNEDGRISLSEFAQAVVNVMKDQDVGTPVSQEELDELIHTGNFNFSIETNEVFQQMDEDSDGFISLKELKTHLSVVSDKPSDEDLMKEFSLLDKDQDGLISKADFPHSTETMPLFDSDEIIDFEQYKKATHLMRDTVTDEEVTLELNDLDQNGDNAISIPEFQVFVILNQIKDQSDFVKWVDELLKEKPTDVSEELIDAFRLFDPDGSGFATQDELQMALDTLKSRKTTQQEAYDYFKRLDLNRDKMISLSEFQIRLL